MHRLHRWWWHHSRCNLQSSVYSRSPWCTKCRWRRENRNLNTTGSSRDLVTLACLTLSAISLGLAMQGWWGASCMLTSSQPKQHARLAALAQKSSNLVPPLAPSQLAAVILALSSIWALLHGLEPAGGGPSWAGETALSPYSLFFDGHRSCGLCTLCLLTYLIR